jgi:hypothetical protein
VAAFGVRVPQPKDGTLYVTYDLGGWSKGMRRDVVGRTLKVEL